MEKQRQAFFEELMGCSCPSGFEEQAQEIIRRRLQGQISDVTTDVHGNVLAGLNTGAPLRVMLAGHVDEIGLMITHIDENGFCYFQAIGGVDPSVLPGQRVLIHGAEHPVHGVIGRKAIHLLSEEERKKALKPEDLFIDIGASNGKEARKHVRVSDPVTIDAALQYLLGDRAISRAFDDRIGAFVVVETLLALAKRKPKVAVWAVSTVQEELGQRGARTSAFGLEPHVGLAVDVGHVSDYAGAEKERRKLGEVSIGKGPILHRGANINPVVGRGLEQIAEAKRIPYQLQAAPRPTGTDANVMQVNRSGVATGVVSIPNRYMHTPVELISLKDVEHTIRLLVEYVLSLKTTDTFIPGLSRPAGRRR